MILPDLTVAPLNSPTTTKQEISKQTSETVTVTQGNQSLLPGFESHKSKDFPPVFDKCFCSFPASLYPQLGASAAHNT